LDCAQIRDALARGELPEGPELGAHRTACAACAELFAGAGSLGRELTSWSEQEGGQAEGLKATLALVERERGAAAWLRSRPTSARIGLVVGAIGVATFAVLALMPRPDLGVYPIVRLAAAVATYALGAGLAVRAALRPLQASPLPGAVRGAILGLALLLPFAIAAAPAAHLAHPASIAGAEASLLSTALPCFLFGAAFGLPVLLLLLAASRGGVRAWTALLLPAAAAGLAGILVLELHCPITHPPHLTLGHATIGLALAGVLLVITALRRK
jgi:hypothetical protein